jgi:hypothetical protein
VLEALVDLPPESAPAAAFTPRAIVRSRAALVSYLWRGQIAPFYVSVEDELVDKAVVP